MLYFAYGSNMECVQMKGRCPSTSFVGIAKLPNYRLAFTRHSTGRGCGVADAVPEKGHRVWGVVFKIAESDIDRLDKCEGYQPGREWNSYWRRECKVFLDGDEGQPVCAQTYFAEREENPPLPKKAYMELILSGARFWQLPPDYIAELEAIKVSE